jgi:hypothetical protein
LVFDEIFVLSSFFLCSSVVFHLHQGIKRFYDAFSLLTASVLVSGRHFLKFTLISAKERAHTFSYADVVFIFVFTRFLLRLYQLILYQIHPQLSQISVHLRFWHFAVLYKIFVW